MISKYLTILPAVAAALLFAACSQDELAEQGNSLSNGAYPLEIGSVSITAEVDEAPSTRVSENSDGASSVFQENDEITVQLGDETATYTIDASNNLTSTTPLYWKNTLDATVNAWYLSPSAESDGSVSLADQSAGLAYVISGTGTGNYQSPVSLTFSHQLAKVRIKLSGTVASSITSVEVYSSTSCSFDPTTQTLTAGEEQDYIPMMQCTYGDDLTCWEANVVPGEITSPSTFIRLNGSIIVPFSAITTLEAGKVHTVDVAMYKVFISTADDLIAAVANGGTYTLTSDIALSSTLSVTATTPVIINLNGHSISNSTIYSTISVASDDVDLTINGNGMDGSKVSAQNNTHDAINMTAGKVTINGGTYTGRVYCNGGSLAITDGTFNGYVNSQQSGAMTISGGTFKGFVGSAGGGSMTISGGIFEGEVCCVSDEGVSTLTITGGTFTGAVTSNSEYGGTATIEISGGEFTGNVTSNSEYGGTATIEITGGTFSGALTCTTDDLGGTATITISKGTFYNYEPSSDYIADGCTVTETKDTEGTTCYVVE